MGKNKKRSDYADNWEEIADSIKERDGWKCQGCSLQFEEGNSNLGQIETENGLKFRRLTVHHKNSDHTDNNPSNLISLCCSCHLKEEGKIRSENTAAKKIMCQVQKGQLFLWEMCI